MSLITSIILKICISHPAITAHIKIALPARQHLTLHRLFADITGNVRLRRRLFELGAMMALKALTLQIGINFT
jgi:hypothetical protein